MLHKTIIYRSEPTLMSQLHVGLLVFNALMRCFTRLDLHLMHTTCSFRSTGAPSDRQHRNSLHPLEENAASRHKITRQHFLLAHLITSADVSGRFWCFNKSKCDAFSVVFLFLLFEQMTWNRIKLE